MLTVTKNNPVVAEIDIFPVEPEQQQSLVDHLIDDIKTVFKQQPGFVAASEHYIHQSVKLILIHLALYKLRKFRRLSNNFAKEQKMP